MGTCYGQPFCSACLLGRTTLSGLHLRSRKSRDHHSEVLVIVIVNDGNINICVAYLPVTEWSDTRFMMAL